MFGFRTIWVLARCKMLLVQHWGRHARLNSPDTEQAFIANQQPLLLTQTIIEITRLSPFACLSLDRIVLNRHNPGEPHRTKIAEKGVTSHVPGLLPPQPGNQAWRKLHADSGHHQPPPPPPPPRHPTTTPPHHHAPLSF